MNTLRELRVKAAEYAALAKAAHDPDETQEFQKLEQSFTTLADNEQWLTDHQDQTIQAADPKRSGLAVQKK